MHVDDAIRTRRSHKVFAGQPVDAKTVRQLLDLAIWAPNHRHTEPWRFAVCLGPRLADLAEASAALLERGGDKGRAKIAKTREMLQQCGAVIGVSYVRSPDDPVRDREDYAATACAIENLLLGMLPRGLVGYWTTSGALIAKDLYPFWQVAEGEELIGAIVLGAPAVAMPAVRYKTVDDVTRWL